MKRHIEIRAAEGGQDAKLFVHDLASAFEAFSLREGWKAESSGENPVVVTLSGKGVGRLDGASGGYRIQRVPPTEKRGRVHTSTVTVAVMKEAPKHDSEIDKSDLRIEWFGGTVKAGGQHRNKHQNSCRVTHIPTGVVETRQGRKRDANLREAMAAIADRVSAETERAGLAKEASKRRSRVGTGQRGDKVLTLRMQDDTVCFHATGKTEKARKFMRGDMSILLS